jgi:hypothetical protein
MKKKEILEEKVMGKELETGRKRVVKQKTPMAGTGKHQKHQERRSPESLTSTWTETQL